MSAAAPPAGPTGAYISTLQKQVVYGPGSLSAQLPKVIKELGGSKAFIITGNSLATKTPIISEVEAQLKEQGLYGATYSGIAQHAPIEGIRKAVEVVNQTGSDIIVAIGGGSPIDAGKAVSYLHNEKTPGSDKFLPLIAVPTTLSVAETTHIAGYTNEEHVKVPFIDPHLIPSAIIYDGELALHTPMSLWLSTGLRAVDHAIETLYRNADSNILRYGCLGAIRDLFAYLPACKANPDDVSIRQRLFIAVWQSLWPELRDLHDIGLDHHIGHVIGASYDLAHGFCSALTLWRTIQYIAESPKTCDEKLVALADALDFIPAPYNPSPAPLAAAPGLRVKTASREELTKSGVQVSQAVKKLVEDLGLKTTLATAKIDVGEIDKIAVRITNGEEGTPFFKDMVQLLHDVA